MKTNIGLLLTKRAHLNPDREAYVESDGSRRYSFRDLNDRANQVANALKADGLKKGDRVGLLLMNSVEFMESFFAVAKIGGVVVPLNWRLVADELEFILKDAGVQTLIFDNEFAETVSELHHRGDKTNIGQWIHVVGGAGSACQPFATSYDGYRLSASSAEPNCGAEDDDMLTITLSVTQRIVNADLEKTYDGNTNVAASSLKTNGISNTVLGHSLNLTGTGAMSSTGVGIDKTVSIGTLSLTGSQAANYTLTGGAHTIDVNPRSTNASGSRHYDGSLAVRGNDQWLNRFGRRHFIREHLWRCRFGNLYLLIICFI